MINVVVAIKEQDVLSIKTALEEGSFEFADLIVHRSTGAWRPYNGFIVYDMVVKGYAIDFLLGLYPDSKIIGSWDMDGVQQSPFDSELWLNHQKDVCTGIYEPGIMNTISCKRPTKLGQVHKFTDSWKDRDLT